MSLPRYVFSGSWESLSSHRTIDNQTMKGPSHCPAGNGGPWRNLQSAADLCFRPRGLISRNSLILSGIHTTDTNPDEKTCQDFPQALKEGCNRNRARKERGNYLFLHRSSNGNFFPPEASCPQGHHEVRSGLSVSRS